MQLKMAAYAAVFVVLGSLTACAIASPITSPRDAMSYLMQYNYLRQSDMQNGMPMTEEIMVSAIKRFQNFANITESGELDSKTMETMNLPRCGMWDIMSNSDAARKKRYTLSQLRWPNTDLTYRIDGRTPDLPATRVDEIMQEALQVWADVSSLTFRRVGPGQPADILISFATGSHGDGNPFDGPGSVLAHAYFPSSAPIAGDAHFDEDEQYTDGVNRGINLFQVAAHEFGHSLGLGHSQIDSALMAPFYRGYVPNFELHSDDIAGIQAHYGPNVGEPEEMGTPTTPVEDCMKDVSVATRTADGNTYFMNGTHVFRIDSNEQVPTGYPRLIGQEFPGLPSNPDAALFYPPNGKTYVFKGSQYYRLTNQAIDSGFPKSISGDFPRLPNDLSSAFIWSGNGRIYFTKGDMYYRYTPGSGVDAGYPRPLSVWRGLPTTVDAAFQYSNSRTYFFSGSDYYRYNDQSFAVDTGYPRNTAVLWLGCNPAELGLTPSTNAPGGNGNAAAVIPSVIAIFMSVLLVNLF